MGANVRDRLSLPVRGRPLRGRRGLRRSRGRSLRTYRMVELKKSHLTLNSISYLCSRGTLHL